MQSSMPPQKMGGGGGAFGGGGKTNSTRGVLCPVEGSVGGYKAEDTPLTYIGKNKSQASHKQLTNKLQVTITHKSQPDMVVRAAGG